MGWTAWTKDLSAGWHRMFHAVPLFTTVRYLGDVTDNLGNNIIGQHNKIRYYRVMGLKT